MPRFVVCMIFLLRAYVQGQTCWQWYLYDKTNPRAYAADSNFTTLEFNAAPMNMIENIPPSSFNSPVVPMQFSALIFERKSYYNWFTPLGAPATEVGTPYNVGVRSSSFPTEFHGIGISNRDILGDREGEIQANNMIQMDTLAAQTAYPSAADLFIKVASCQIGQSYGFYGSNVAGQLGTYLGFQGQLANDRQAVAVPNWKKYRYLGVKALSPTGLSAHTNVLVQSVYMGTGCKPPLYYYPSGYKNGGSSTVIAKKTNKPNFKPSKKPVKAKPSKNKPV